MARYRKTWVVVADAASSRVFLRDRPGRGMTLVDGGSLENPKVHGHARDLGTDRPGRSFDCAGGARHAQDPRTDLHRQAKADFANRLADYVEQGAAQKKFERLILVAPPQMLGDLRAALDRQSARLVTDSIDKDLTKLSPAEIADYLQPLIVL
jgi:protein required for attachment to host cells